MAAAAPGTTSTPPPSDQTLIEQHFLGLNLSAAPIAMPDGMFLALDNLIPYADGHLAVMPGPLAIGSNTGGVTVAIWFFEYNNVPCLFAQLSTGALHVATVTEGPWSWEEIVAPEGTTVNGLHLVKWSGVDADGNPAAILWTDTINGYGSWVGGTSWKVLESSLNGQCLAVYSGRVWLASGSTIYYSAPDSYSDFTLADYGGSFTITDPTMGGDVVAMQASQGWLYLIGPGMMALNNVQLQSVATATVLSTTFYLTSVSASIAITNERAAIVWDNILLVLTQTGLWGYNGLNGQQISLGMGDNFSGSQSLYAMQVYGRNMIGTSAGYLFMMDSQQWFTTLADVAGFLSTTWLNDGDVVAYACNEAGDFFQIGADMSTVRTCTWNTRLFDAGNASINKRVMKIGIDVWPDELAAGDPTGVGSCTLQAVGWLTTSPVVTDTNFSVIRNQWLPHSIDLTDRYFGMAGVLTAPPGTAIGSMLFQFQDSTSWPAATGG